MRCEEASRHLTRVIDGDGELPDAVAAHLGSCLRCQVEAVRYRRVARTMRQLRHQVAPPAPDLVDDILSLVAAAQVDGASRSRLRVAAYVAAGAAATAAGAAGAIVLASRSRRGRLDLAG